MKLSSCIMVLSHRCNYNCIHCYDKQKTDLFDTERIYENAKVLLKKFKKMGLKEVLFSGGECTLFPKIHELVDCANKLGILPSIFTNGSSQDVSLFTKLKSVCTSVDGNCATHNIIRRNPAAYQNVVTFLTNPVIKEKPIIVQTTISKTNISDLSYITDIAQMLSFPKDTLKIYAMSKTTDSKKNSLLLTQDEYIKVSEYIQNLCKSYDYHINISTDIIDTDVIKTINLETLLFPLFIDIGQNKFYVFADIAALSRPLDELSVDTIKCLRQILILKIKSGISMPAQKYGTIADFLIDKN
ncbi:MAG: radical SAM protein [Alphaproteobacteria bacterium]